MKLATTTLSRCNNHTVLEGSKTKQQRFLVFILVSPRGLLMEPYEESFESLKAHQRISSALKQDGVRMSLVVSTRSTTNVSIAGQ